MKIVARNETTGASFTIYNAPRDGIRNEDHPIYLRRGTELPTISDLSLNTQSYAYRNGGTTSRSKFSPLPVTLDIGAIEYYQGESIMELIAKGRTFFDPHGEDLRVNRFTLDFFTQDGKKSAFRLRRGVISEPFNLRFEEDSEHVATGQISFIFDNDPLMYYLDESEGGADIPGAIVKFTLTPEGQIIGNKTGRTWLLNGAEWRESGKVWKFPEQGGVFDTITVDLKTTQRVPCEVVFYGECVNPTLINSTNGTLVRYFGTIDAGSSLIVKDDGTATIDGVSVTVDGQLLASKGLNTFILTVQSSDGGSADVKIRGAF